MRAGISNTQENVHLRGALETSNVPEGPFLFPLMPIAILQLASMGVGAGAGSRRQMRRLQRMDHFVY